MQSHSISETFFVPKYTSRLDEYSFSAEIGGYMGLCLGASILTVFELWELLLDYCTRLKNNTGKQSHTTKVHDIRMECTGEIRKDDLSLRG